MAKPVIMAIDDDMSVLNSIERDLRAHYGQDYRILPINEGKVALEYLKKLEAHNASVQATCQKLGVVYHKLATDRPLELTLFDFLRSRMDRGKKIKRGRTRAPNRKR